MVKPKSKAARLKAGIALLFGFPLSTNDPKRLFDPLSMPLNNIPFSWFNLCVTIGRRFY